MTNTGVIARAHLVVPSMLPKTTKYEQNATTQMLCNPNVVNAALVGLNFERNKSESDRQTPITGIGTRTNSNTLKLKLSAAVEKHRIALIAAIFFIVSFPA